MAVSVDYDHINSTALSRSTHPDPPRMRLVSHKRPATSVPDTRRTEEARRQEGDTVGTKAPSPPQSARPRVSGSQTASQVAWIATCDLRLAMKGLAVPLRVSGRVCLHAPHGVDTRRSKPPPQRDSGWQLGSQTLQESPSLRRRGAGARPEMERVINSTAEGR